MTSGPRSSKTREGCIAKDGGTQTEVRVVIHHSKNRSDHGFHLRMCPSRGGEKIEDAKT